MNRIWINERVLTISLYLQSYITPPPRLDYFEKVTFCPIWPSELWFEESPLNFFRIFFLINGLTGRQQQINIVFSPFQKKMHIEVMIIIIMFTWFYMCWTIFWNKYIFKSGFQGASCMIFTIFYHSNRNKNLRHTVQFTIKQLNHSLQLVSNYNHRCMDKRTHKQTNDNNLTTLTFHFKVNYIAYINNSNTYKNIT